jgi:hypothetical protein
MPNHVYTVELRFTGDTLDLAEVGQRLNLQPSSSSPPHRTRKGRAFWAYNGHDQPGFQAEWESLEQGLDFLLNILSPHQSAVIELSRRYTAWWWCGHFQSSFDGGPILSPGLLTRIAAYGVQLAIDNYFSSDADDARLQSEENP